MARDRANAGEAACPDVTRLTDAELEVTLIVAARLLLAEIDDAIDRLARGQYGWDASAGVWIRAERLRALPWARHEVAIAEAGRPPSVVGEGRP